MQGEEAEAAGDKAEGEVEAEEMAGLGSLFEEGDGNAPGQQQEAGSADAAASEDEEGQALFDLWDVPAPEPEQAAHEATLAVRHFFVLASVHLANIGLPPFRWLSHLWDLLYFAKA